jgi:tRNA-dihydrouridine synthase
MIGRAATTKPWIFDQLGGNHKTLDRQEIALDFIQNVLTYQPEAFWKTRIQRFFFYYCEQFQYGHYFQTKMLNYKSPEESRKEVLDYFEKQKEERFITY